MALQRHVQLVGGASVHAAIRVVGKVGVVVEVDPRTDHQAVGAGLGETRVQERVGRAQAAGIAHQAGACPVDPGAGDAAVHRGECAAGDGLQPQRGRGLEAGVAGDQHRLVAPRLRVEHGGRHLDRPAASHHAGVVDVEEAAHAAVTGLRVRGREAGEPGRARRHPDLQRGGVGRPGGGVGAGHAAHRGVDPVGQGLRQFGQRGVGIGGDAVVGTVERDLPGFAGAGLVGRAQRHGGRGVERAGHGGGGVGVRGGAQLAGAVDGDLGAVGAGQHQVAGAAAGHHGVQRGQRTVGVVEVAHMGNAAGGGRGVVGGALDTQ